MLKQIMKGTFEEGEQTTTKASNYQKSVTVDNPGCEELWCK